MRRRVWELDERCDEEVHVGGRKEDIAELRRKLSTGSETITMLAITAMRYAATNGGERV